MWIPLSTSTKQWRNFNLKLVDVGVVDKNFQKFGKQNQTVNREGKSYQKTTSDSDVWRRSVLTHTRVHSSYWHWPLPYPSFGLSVVVFMHSDFGLCLGVCSMNFHNLWCRPRCSRDGTSTFKKTNCHGLERSRRVLTSEEILVRTNACADSCAPCCWCETSSSPSPCCTHYTNFSFCSQTSGRFRRSWLPDFCTHSEYASTSTARSGKSASPSTFVVAAAVNMLSLIRECPPSSSSHKIKAFFASVCFSCVYFCNLFNRSSLLVIERSLEHLCLVIQSATALPPLLPPKRTLRRVHSVVSSDTSQRWEAQMTLLNSTWKTSVFRTVKTSHSQSLLLSFSLP